MQTRFERVGVEVINSRRHEVYALPCGTRVVQTVDPSTGNRMTLPVESAKLFKKGTYEFHPDIEPVASSFFTEDTYMLAEDAVQTEIAERLLRAITVRVVDDRLVSAINFGSN